MENSLWIEEKIEFLKVLWKNYEEKKKKKR